MKFFLTSMLVCCFSGILKAQPQTANSNQFVLSDSLQKAAPTSAKTPGKWLLEDAPAVSLGFKGGLNLTAMDFNKGFPRPSFPVKTFWKTGFIIGFKIEVPFSRRISIHQEYLYSYRRGEHIYLSTDYTLSYLSLPLLVSYWFTSKINLKFGPQFDLLIKSRQTTHDGNSDITNNTEGRSVGAIAGIKYKLRKYLNLEARYIHGIHPIGIVQHPLVTEHQYRIIQLTTGITF